MREPGGMMGAVTADPAAQRDVTAGATALAIEIHIDDETSP